MISPRTPVIGCDCCPSGSSGEGRDGKDRSIVGVSWAAIAGWWAGSAVLAAVMVRRGVFSGPGLGKRSAAAVLGVPGLVWLAGACVLFLAPAIGASVVMGLPAGVVGDVGSMQRRAATDVAAYGGAIAVGAALLWLLRPRLGKGAGVTLAGGDLWRGGAGLVLATPFYVATALTATAVYTLVRGEPPEPLAHESLRQMTGARTDPWTIVRIVGVVVGAPIYEELLYRVFIQTAAIAGAGMILGQGTRAVWAGILGTSGVFAAMHVAGGGPVPWHAAAGLFVLSVALGLAYEKTGRLGVPIVMHALFNAANVAMAMRAA
jgi:membrane protease YdiL (CAAX protease family)